MHSNIYESLWSSFFEYSKKLLHSEHKSHCLDITSRIGPLLSRLIAKELSSFHTAGPDDVSDNSSITKKIVISVSRTTFIVDSTMHGNFEILIPIQSLISVQ